MTIQKVAVIGAGVMGAGIAAQLANAGYDVELLDRVSAKEGTERSAIAAGAIERMLKTSPAPLMHKRNAKKIRAGNTDDNIDRLKECDLIIEAVFEDPKVKFDIFQKIDANRKAGSIVASNTSTIPLHDLMAGQSDQFKKDFVITHFFNPPRYMQLLELVTSEHNSKETVAELTRFLDEKMGKGVVVCNDTPGFIANRIGTFWIQCAINEAHNKKLTVEEADAVMGRPIGVPKTGVFGLVDMVGLDLMPHISKSLLGKLPADDAYCKIYQTFPMIDAMIADGYTGRKGKGGFYRLNEAREKQVVSLVTGIAAPAAAKVKMPALEASKKKGIKGLIESKDKGGDYAWSVLKQTLCYTAEHANTISSGVQAVDDAMKLGYNWKQGPFELIDKIGTSYFIKRLEAEGEKVPAFLKQAEGKTFYRVENGKKQVMQADGSYADIQRPDGVILLSDIKLATKPVAKNMSASLWDIGDGALCLEFHSKMNSIDFFTMNMMNKACDIIGDGKGKYKTLVIHNEADDFSIGANILVAAVAAKLKQYWLVDKLVHMGQETYKRLKYSPFPVVSTSTGRVLGGGCEVLLSSNHVQAHAETYMGLVEVGVGLLPAWGGSTELLTRALQSKKIAHGPMPPIANVFETISTAKVSPSAFEAKDMLYLRESDGITMNKARLLTDAKAKALDMAKDYTPEKPYDLKLPGVSGLAALNMAVDSFYLKGAVTGYDVVVSDKVARVLTGGDQADVTNVVTQDYVRSLEHKYFMALMHDDRTINRVMTTLKGKGRKEYEPVERATKKQPAALLRLQADQPSLFLKAFTTCKQAFSGVCHSGKAACHPCANDNEGVKADTKPKVNWPKV